MKNKHKYLLFAILTASSLYANNVAQQETVVQINALWGVQAYDTTALPSALKPREWNYTADDPADPEPSETVGIFLHPAVVKTNGQNNTLAHPPIDGGVAQFDAVAVFMVENRACRIIFANTSGVNAVFSGEYGTLASSLITKGETATLLVDELVPFETTTLRRIVFHRRAKPEYRLGTPGISAIDTVKSIIIYGGEQRDSARHPKSPYLNIFPDYKPTRLRYVNPALSNNPSEQKIYGGISGVKNALSAIKSARTAYRTIGDALNDINKSTDAGCLIIIADGIYNEQVHISGAEATQTNPLVLIGETVRGATIMGPAREKEEGRAFRIDGTSDHIHLHNLKIQGRGTGGSDANTLMIEPRAGSGGMGGDGLPYASGIARGNTIVTGCEIIGGEQIPDAFKITKSRGHKIVGNIIRQKNGPNVQSAFDNVNVHDTMVAFNDFRGSAINGLQMKGFPNRWIVVYNDFQMNTPKKDSSLIDLGGGGKDPKRMLLPGGNSNNYYGLFYGGTGLQAIGNRVEQLGNGCGISVQGAWKAQVAANHIIVPKNNENAVFIASVGYALRNDDGSRVMPSSLLSLTAPDRWTRYYDNIAKYYPESIGYIVLMHEKNGVLGREDQTGITLIDPKTFTASPDTYVSATGTGYFGTEPGRKGWHVRLFPKDAFVLDNTFEIPGLQNGMAYTPLYDTRYPKYVLTDKNNRHKVIMPEHETTALNNTIAGSKLPPVGRAGWNDTAVYAKLGMDLPASKK